MTRNLLTMVMCFLVVAVLVIPVVAQKKEVTLSGKITCAMCDLKTDKACATVIVVKEGGKDAVYYLDEKSSKANHEAICQGGKDGAVTGIVARKDGKQVITASKVEFKK